MAAIPPIPGVTPALLPEQKAQREDLQVQDEAPRQQADTVSLRGRASFDAPEMMTFDEANALLTNLAAAPQGLADAHDTLDPTRVARLLELDLT